MMKSRPRFSVLLLGISATSALRLPATTLPRTNCAASTRHDAALAVLTASAIAIFSCQAPPACAWDGLPTSALLAVVCDDRGRCTQPTGASANLQRAAQSAQSAAGKIKQEADNGQRISQARATKMQADAAKEAKKVIPKDVQKAAAKAQKDAKKEVKKAEKEVKKAEKEVKKVANKLQRELGL